MKKTKNILIMAAAAMVAMSSCIEEVTPGGGSITGKQLQSSATAQAALLPGIAACMTSCYYNGGGDYGVAGNAGYPSLMYLRDCWCEDFPVANDSYSYYAYYENGNSVTYLGYYVMKYYYDLIHNCNNVMPTTNAEPSADEKPNIAIALGFRALAYMELARFFEYQPTGYPSIDDQAVSMGCMKLTASIVTESTTAEELKNNPRAPYYTMYRFIMNDLNTAEQYMQNAPATSIIYPNLNAIYGLKARLWLEMASRFDLMPEDLAEQIAHESDDDGYAPIGVKTARDCYAKAAEYAQKAMTGYQPMTRATYQNKDTGFNTADPASWIWIMRNSSTDEFEDLYYYYSFLGQMASEPSWAMAQYGGLYRCISKSLYDSMEPYDWRRYSYVSPDVAGQKETPADYAPYTNLPYSVKSGTTTTVYSWDCLPAYANLKFRSRSLTDSYDGRIADYPLMRMEEMIFIHAEAVAHTQGVSAGAQEINNFVNNHRQTRPSYRCSEASLEAFTNDMMVQKRIEFWGEGIVMWDYKRLKKGITRAYDNSNYLSKYQMNTKDGYVVPWMNMRFPREYEGVANQAAIGSPDPSQVVEAQ